MIELLQYKFFIHALAAALLTSISCGIIGTYIVARKIVFISGGISHASFGGIGIGHFLGINPILGAAVFSVLSAFGISWFSKKDKIREDSLIGIFWSFGMAVGIIFIFLTPGYAPNLMSYLFGNILTVSAFYLYLLTGLTLIVILFFILFFKEILYIAFDEEYARTQNIPVALFNYSLLCLIALTIVMNIKTTGIILVISLLTIPQAIAGLFSKNFRDIIFLSIGFGFLTSVAGLIISYYLNIPSGATIIFVLIFIFFCLSVGKKFFRQNFKEKD